MDQPIEQDYKQVPSTGLLTAAWHDVCAMPNVAGRVLLLSLIDCVPILGWAASGWRARWGRRAAFSQEDTGRPGVFEDRSFSIGFFIFVIVLVWSIILGFFEMIPVVGWAALILLMPPMSLAATYAAIIGEIGAGFRITDMWKKIQRNIGSVLAIYWLPTLIVAVIEMLLVILATTASGVSLVVFESIDTYSTAQITALAQTMVASGFFGWICLAAVVSVIASCVSSLVIYRAYGYWVARFAPEWVVEACQKREQPE